MLEHEEIVRRCLHCGKHFASVAEAREAYRAIHGLNVDQLDEIARRIDANPQTVQGLRIMFGYACVALDWLEYHGRPLTKRELKLLHDEFDGRDSLRNVLAWELKMGAWQVVREVDWKDESR